MQQFIVLYMAPAKVLEDWAKTDPEKRKTEEKKMQEDWGAWMKAHAKMFAGKTAGVGKTKRVTSSGVADAKNDIMLYSIVEASSHEAAAKEFEGHPHLGIPEAWIDIMPLNYLPGMN